MMMARSSRSYWINRRLAEREWQEQQLADDKKFNQLLERQYTRLATDLNKEIEREVYSLASRNKQPYAEAAKAVRLADVADYEDLAKQVVEQANKMRAEGKTPSYADWSDDVNQRLRTYNATMRINRMEYIKSEIGLRLTENTMSIADYLRIKLTDNYRDEVLRQAGILGMSVQTAKAWVNNHTISTVMKQTAGGNWSQRLWADQDALKAKLDQVLATGIINGSNPREMARKLKDNVSKTVKNQRYVTERLARTESARVQFQAQKQMIKENGFKYVEWFAEPSACAECKRIANKENSHGKGVYVRTLVPDIPVHPNCRCSIGAYYSDEMLDEKLKELGFGEEKAKNAKINIKPKGLSIDDVVKQIVDEETFAKYAQRNLGIEYVSGMTKVPAKQLQQIYRSMAETYEQFPEIKGLTKDIIGYKRSNSRTIAAAHFGGRLLNSDNYMQPSDYKITFELRFNTAWLGSDADERVLSSVKNGWNTQRDGFKGDVDHEMGHFVDYYYTAKKIGLNPFKDVMSENEISRYTETFRNDMGFSSDVIKSALKKAGIDFVMPEILEAYISGYGKTNLQEAFAEMFADQSNREFKKQFDQALQEAIKKEKS